MSRILVIEDEPLIQMMWEDIIDLAGSDVVGRASTVTGALEIISDTEFDIAILDVNLCGEQSTAVAEELAKLKKRTLVATGDDPTQLPQAFRCFKFVRKPFRTDEVIAELDALIDA